MDLKGIVSIAVLTAAVFGLIWGAGVFVKKVPAGTLKYINYAVSAVAFVSGLASYATGESIYGHIFLVSLVAYFLTISFKAEEK